MGDAIGKAAAFRQVDGNRIEIGLQLERRDVTAGRMRHVTGRAAEPGTDIEHPALGSESQWLDRVADGIDAVIVPLVSVTASPAEVRSLAPMPARARPRATRSRFV